MQIYIVQKQDTFESIAEKFNLDLEAFKAENKHLSRQGHLAPGIKLRLPKAFETHPVSLSSARELGRMARPYLRPRGAIEVINGSVKKLNHKQKGKESLKLENRSGREMRRFKRRQTKFMPNCLYRAGFESGLVPLDANKVNKIEKGSPASMADLAYYHQLARYDYDLTVKHLDQADRLCPACHYYRQMYDMYDLPYSILKDPFKD